MGSSGSSTSHPAATSWSTATATRTPRRRTATRWPALYPAAYRLKFASKRAGHDHVVPALEGLWWADDLAAFTTERDKTRWHWTLMILVPDHVDAALLTDVEGPVRVDTLTEGTCVQTLHVGPYDDEAPLLAQLHGEVLPERGLRPTDHHHEIYLGDPRRTDPSRLRTLLRQPVARV